MSRLSISLISFVLLSTLGLGLLMDSLFHSLNDEVDEVKLLNASQIELLLTLITEASDLNQFQELLADITKSRDDISVTTATFDSLLLPDPLVNELNENKMVTLEEQDFITFVKKYKYNDKLLIFTVPHKAHVEEHLAMKMGFTLVFYLLLAGFLLLWIWPLLQRLFVLRKMTHQFGKGELSARIKVGRLSYINDIERDFNHMAQKIENLVADVKLLSTAVSHDLRTPLAKVRMGLDVLSEEANADKRKMYESKINQHLDHISELVDTLLKYARLEQEKPNLTLQENNARALVDGAIRQLDFESLQIDIQESGTVIPLFSDAQYLSIALNNLLNNAIKHAKTQIKVTIVYINACIEISISDDGPGIDQTIAKTLFKPFVRGRNKQQSGFGMGLAIVERIAEWHQAPVSQSQCEVLTGAKFTIVFPSPYR